MQVNTPESVIHNKLNTHLNILKERGYKVLYVALKGSQNYGLDVYDNTYKSDVDTVAVILPSINTLMEESTIKNPNIRIGEEICDVKDIRHYKNMLERCNPVYIETLFTDYLIINPDYSSEMTDLFNLSEKYIYAMRDRVAKCIKGMSQSKYNNFCLPGAYDGMDLNSFTYSISDLLLIMRLWWIAKKYFDENKSMKDSLVVTPPQRTAYLALKFNNPDYEKAREIANKYFHKTNKLLLNNPDSYTLNNDEDLKHYNAFNDVLMNIFRKNLKEELT